MIKNRDANMKHERRLQKIKPNKKDSKEKKYNHIDTEKFDTNGVKLEIQAGQYYVINSNRPSPKGVVDSPTMKLGAVPHTTISSSFRVGDNYFVNDSSDHTSHPLW